MKLRPGDDVTIGKGGYIWKVAGWQVKSGIITLQRHDPRLGPVSMKVPADQLRMVK